MHAHSSGWQSGARAGTMEDGGLFPRGPAGLASAATLLGLSWLLWYQAGRSELEVLAGPEASSRAIAITAAFGLGSRIASQLIEAGFYAGVWRALGRRLRFGQMFVGIAVLSGLDSLAAVLARQAQGEASPLVVALAGLRALAASPEGGTGLRLAFGGVGLLALMRVGGTVWLQRLDGIPLRRAAALTAGVWLAGRLLTWWMADLARGASPLP